MNDVVESLAPAAQLNIQAAVLATIALGTTVEAYGGSFEAIMKGEAGGPDYALFLAAEQHDEADWKTNQEWAHSLKVGEVDHFDQPTRRELNALRANAKDKFHDDWYWSNEPYGSGLAWCQGFSYGDQRWDGQSYDGIRGCAVRRIPILR